jgi:hypothetical protein
VGAYVVGNMGGCIGTLGSPILEGSKVRGRPGVDGVVGVDEGVLYLFATSSGDGERLRFRACSRR